MKARHKALIFTSPFLIAVAIVCLGANRRGRTSHYVQNLDHPVGVLSWSDTGLVLANGEVVAIPGFRKLPLDSPGLSEAIRSGVEIGWDGRLHGLVRVHHYCGNDPITNHVARIDLTQLLLYLREGSPYDPSKRSRASKFRGNYFSQSGWFHGGFINFERWNESGESYFSLSESLLELLKEVEERSDQQALENSTNDD